MSELSQVAGQLQQRCFKKGRGRSVINGAGVIMPAIDVVDMGLRVSQRMEGAKIGIVLSRTSKKTSGRLATSPR